MILNIFGPSGSGKTSFVRNLLRHGKTQIIYEKLTNKKSNINLNKKIAISLIPLPLFRGTVKEFFDIFSINIYDLLTLENNLKELADSIFNEFNDEKNLEIISSRKLETFSAGEIRRLYLLKSLLVDSNIMIIDEPFSNSDQKLWEIIYKAIDIKSKIIVLSHVSLDNLFDSNQTNICVDIKNIKYFI